MNRPLPFGKYILLERISVGGMAEVFKGRTFGIEGFARFVAIKRILPQLAEDNRFVEMFIDEAKMAAALNHANIAQVIELGRERNDHFIAMEYVAGKDLLALFLHLRKTKQRLPVQLVAFIGHQVAEGLDYAHRKRGADGRPLGIVHRDVSPQNVLVSYDGAVKLIDFGIAKVRKQGYDATRAGGLKGKFGYMSPELIEARSVDLRSDIFSLGVVIWELLCTERLFTGDNEFITLEKVRLAEVDAPSVRNPAVPPELDRILLRALARDPADRYQASSELADDLARFLHTQGHSPSTKDMGAWMRAEFSRDLEEERRKAQKHGRITLTADGRVVEAQQEEEEEPTALWQPDAETADDWARATAPPEEAEVVADPLAVLATGRAIERPRVAVQERVVASRPASDRLAGERPFSERQTAERPAVERPTAERPLTERPTDPLPLTDRPTDLQTRVPTRRTRLPAILAVIVGLLVTAGAAWWLFVRSPSATLVVVANPTKSLVIRVNGKMVGDASPLRLEGLEPTTAVVEVESEGFKPFRESRALIAGEENRVEARLEIELAQMAVLRFAVKPESARILVDGRPVADGVAQVPVGRKVALRIEADGFVAEEESRTFEGGDHGLTYELSQETASIWVDSKPAGNLLLDGRFVTRSPSLLDRLDPNKRYRLRIVADGYQPHEVEVDFKATRHPRLNVTLVPLK